MTKLFKNLMQGAGSVFSISPPPRRARKNRLYKPRKNAVSAMRSDWHKIGGDFNKALKRVAHVEE